MNPDDLICELDAYLNTIPGSSPSYQSTIPQSSPSVTSSSQNLSPTGFLAQSPRLEQNSAETTAGGPAGTCGLGSPDQSFPSTTGAQHTTTSGQHQHSANNRYRGTGQQNPGIGAHQSVTGFKSPEGLATGGGHVFSPTSSKELKVCQALFTYARDHSRICVADVSYLWLTTRDHVFKYLPPGTVTKDQPQLWGVIHGYETSTTVITDNNDWSLVNFIWIYYLISLEKYLVIGTSRNIVFFFLENSQYFSFFPKIEIIMIIKIWKIKM